MSSSLQISPDAPVDENFLQQIENWMLEISRYELSLEGQADTSWALSYFRRAYLLTLSLSSEKAETFEAIDESINKDSEIHNLHEHHHQEGQLDQFDQAAGIAPQTYVVFNEPFIHAN